MRENPLLAALRANPVNAVRPGKVKRTAKSAAPKPFIGSDDKARAIVEEGAAYAAEGVRGQYECGAERCESPIEKMFLAQFLCPKLAADYDSKSEVLLPPSGEIQHVDMPPIDGFYIWPQIKIGQYRVDFVCGVNEHGRKGYCIVECDGHAFHEKTKEQAGRDKARDRYLTAQGFRILRYTGSEVFNDPHAVASEVYQLLLGIG